MPRPQIRNSYSSLALQQQQRLTAAQIQTLVEERQTLRKAKEYRKADAIKLLLESNHIIVTDYPNLTWRRVAVEEAHEEEASESAMKLMKVALLATERSTKRRLGNDDDEEYMNIQDLVRIAKQKLRSVMNSDLSGMLSPLELKITNKDAALEYTGRYMVDCAVKFAFAGVKDEELFELFDACIYSELKRFGGRSSCRAVDVLHIVEKLAVSGRRNSSCYSLAAEILKAKTEDDLKIKLSAIERLESHKFCLLDDRPLLWLFRNSAKQVKQKALEEGYIIPNINTLFEDPSLPLYIDLGCGYGVSNLALSSSTKFSKYNTLGCDVSQTAVGYAESIAHRWGIYSRCRFIHSDCQSCLQAVLSSNYVGSVEGIIVNFPSPYKLNLEGSSSYTGNTQLPSNLNDFLLTDDVVELSRLLLQNRSDNSFPTHPSRRFLLLQSNVEDVAITMKAIVERSKAFDINAFSTSMDDWSFLHEEKDRMLTSSLRQHRWSCDRNIERAYGVGWLKKSPFHDVSRSETEVHCTHNGKMIFRRQFFPL